MAVSMGAGAKTFPVRWGVLLLICLMYLITFIDRSNISIAAPFMLKEFGMTKPQMGLVFSAFLWAYSLGAVPGGWLGDRFGPRIVLALLVLGWSVMTVATGLVSGVVALFTVRFIFGLGEAGALPTATRAMQTWFPRSERGLAQGLTHSFARFGIAVVPPAATAVILAYGWRAMFYLSGILGLVWAIAFFVMYRNDPARHPRMSAEELRVIGDGRPDPAKAAERGAAPWRTLLRNPTLWYASAAWACYNYCIYFFMTWFPTYLVEHLKISPQSMGWVASLPLLAGVVGDVLGGVLTDAVLKRTGRLRFSRAIVAAPAMIGSGLGLLLAAWSTSAVAAIVWLAFSLFCLELVIGPAWAVPMDIAGTRSGTISGLVNTIGNLGGSLSPIVFGILTAQGSWTAPFYISAAVMGLGAVLWAGFIDPEGRGGDPLRVNAVPSGPQPVAGSSE